MPAGSLISRDEVLGGLAGRAAKQASGLLVLVEGQTAYLKAQAAQAMVPYLTEQVASERSRAFLEALALERQPPVPPTIRELERWAPHWASLVPENPNLRAMVARLLGQKYTFTQALTPRLQVALGLNNAPVQEAYRRLYAAPLASIYAGRLGLADRLRWLWAGFGTRLDELSPFWTAYALTLTNTVGAGVLALPIALAQVGPLAGVVILILLGLVNVLTIAWMGETLARTSSVRYGKTFMGRVVSDYLGSRSALVLSISTLAYCVLALFAYYIGFSTTLAGVTPIPAWAWVGLLFAVNVFFVRRRSLNATVASALGIGALNICLILIISALAFTRVQTVNLSYIAVPGINGQPFNAQVLQLTFGVVLGVFTGHLSVSNCAQVVLRRDPSGRSLIHGAAAALLTAIVLFCVWVVAVNGAIAPPVLAREMGTALVPLAARLGMPIRVLGTLYVIFGIGMISIHTALGLFNLSREWMSRGKRGGRLPERWRSLLLLIPLAAVFLATEWLLLTGSGSFATITSLRGALAAPLLAGIFPALLLLASRRKGEIVPETVYRRLGQTWLVAGSYGLFVASLLLHGLVIWPDLPRRVAALVVAGVVLGMTMWLVRRGMLARRVVIELRHDQRKGHTSGFTVASGGRPLVATARVAYNGGEEQLEGSRGNIPSFTTLRSVSFNLPVDGERDIKVATYRITPEGDIVALAGSLVVHTDTEPQTFDLTTRNGQVVLPAPTTPYSVEVRLTERS